MPDNSGPTEAFRFTALEVEDQGEEPDEVAKEQKPQPEDVTLEFEHANHEEGGVTATGAELSFVVGSSSSSSSATGGSRPRRLFSSAFKNETLPPPPRVQGFLLRTGPRSKDTTSGASFSSFLNQDSLQATLKIPLTGQSTTSREESFGRNLTSGGSSSSSARPPEAEDSTAFRFCLNAGSSSSSEASDDEVVYPAGGGGSKVAFPNEDEEQLQLEHREDATTFPALDLQEVDPLLQTLASAENMAGWEQDGSVGTHLENLLKRESEKRERALLQWQALCELDAQEEEQRRLAEKKRKVEDEAEAAKTKADAEKAGPAPAEKDDDEVDEQAASIISKSKNEGVAGEAEADPGEPEPEKNEDQGKSGTADHGNEPDQEIAGGVAADAVPTEADLIKTAGEEAPGTGTTPPADTPNDTEAAPQEVDHDATTLREGEHETEDVGGDDEVVAAHVDGDDQEQAQVAPGAEPGFVSENAQPGQDRQEQEHGGEAMTTDTTSKPSEGGSFSCALYVPNDIFVDPESGFETDFIPNARTRELSSELTGRAAIFWDVRVKTKLHAGRWIHIADSAEELVAQTEKMDALLRWTYEYALVSAKLRAIGDFSTLQLPQCYYAARRARENRAKLLTV
ncbi:unnamed protein product [Amoebophrya sp. A120]|nr:unnamed protein product [Amoebophrya sp. A120]|eukprot:GSA120T00004350001.1